MPVNKIDDILCVSWIDAAQLPSYFEIAKNALSWKGKVMGQSTELKRELVELAL